ncbi:hypothetical protein VTK73DRAFT_8783 [Phialemonium thermophilum]|uniref:CMP/dCMP-type deaminase domain-containing protein n=1 Tax=Phialemonium thermophilum TaxID=223376 RepID=A0ABR3XMW9_9PEZI
MEIPKPGDHKAFIQLALQLAKKSKPLPTNFRVGCVLVDTTSHQILETGYTLELPGNTHAEQCCFMKLAEKYGVPEERLSEVLPSSLGLYVTMEPCSKRLSGNKPCVERIIRLAGVIKTVYVGVREPQKFVSNTGWTAMESVGIEVVHVGGLEDEILEVATAGHLKDS